MLIPEMPAKLSNNSMEMICLPWNLTMSSMLESGHMVYVSETLLDIKFYCII